MIGKPRTPKTREPGSNQRSPEDTNRIRDATLKRILDAPPKRHADIIKDRRSKPKEPPDKS